MEVRTQWGCNFAWMAPRASPKGRPGWGPFWLLSREFFTIADCCAADAHAIDEFIQWHCSGTLALDAEKADSPRDEAIDAVSTRPREDQPNEDQNV
jgi:hypothetical protein